VQDNLFKLGNDLKDVAFPQTEPPKPSKFPGKREHRNLLIAAELRQRKESGGKGFLTSAPLIALANKTEAAQKAAEQKAQAVAEKALQAQAKNTQKSTKRKKPSEGEPA
jgi:hypothetical protein